MPVDNSNFISLTTLVFAVQAQRGTVSTLLADADRPVFATGALVDPLSVVANLQELLSSAAELSMSPCGI